MRRSKTSRYVTIVATFGLALGIGFVMQNGDAVASRLGVDASSGPKEVVPDTYIPVRASGVLAPDTPVPDMSAPASDDGADAGCAIGFEAAPTAAAMVALSLNAPCNPDTLVTVQHQGMKFHALTDADGVLTVDVPALSKEAFFIATVDQGEGVVAITGVPDLAMYDRAVLQWRGVADVHLHALEFGAEPGTDGHVWAAAHRSPEVSVGGEQGFMTRLGTDQSPVPLMVEIYTYPSGMSLNDGSVALSVQTEVTAENCGRTVAAQSIQLRPDHPPAAKNMSLRIPSCDNVGEFLVLKNMFEDLTLAAR